MSSNGFSRRLTSGLPYYCCEAFERLGIVRHGFSTRHGAIPGGFDLGYSSREQADRVELNRNRFAAALGLGTVPLVTLRQLHSDIVQVIRGLPAGTLEGDALASDQPGVSLAVQVADCFPVLIADPARKAVGAVHAGWRGVLARILTKTITRMQESFGCNPRNLNIAIGPGIRSCCLEVGAEVTGSFEQAGSVAAIFQSRRPRTGKVLLDLPAALRAECLDSGVPAAQIHDLGLCTCCGVSEFFSYRAEGLRSGRMMGAVTLRSTA